MPCKAITAHQPLPRNDYAIDAHRGQRKATLLIRLLPHLVFMPKTVVFYIQAT